MPTLNYQDVGALVQYDYLQGRILALYPEDDTADVESESEGSVWTLMAVPIFYHCEPDSEVRTNGAITGSASGFAVDDLVIVLKSIDGAKSKLGNPQIELQSIDSKATGPEYYVVGHYDGVVKCVARYLVVSAHPRTDTTYPQAWASFYSYPAPFYNPLFDVIAGDWLWIDNGFGPTGYENAMRAYSKDPFFVWDVANNDYADSGVYVIDGGGKVTLTKASYPYTPSAEGDVLLDWSYSQKLMARTIYDFPTDPLYQPGIGDVPALPRDAWAENLSKELKGQQEVPEGKEVVQDFQMSGDTSRTAIPYDHPNDPYTASLDGQVNPLGSTSWSYTTGNPPTGDWLHTFGMSTWLDDFYAVQLYTYRNFEDNTVAQCTQIDKDGIWNVSSRNVALETACKNLIRTAAIDFPYDAMNYDRYIELESFYFKSVKPYNLLKYINIERVNAGLPIQYNSVYCASTAQKKIDFFLAESVFQHEDENGNPFDPEHDGGTGLENLFHGVVGIDHALIVASWMASPHHRDTVLAKILNPFYPSTESNEYRHLPYFGYASGVYPVETERITMGPGIFIPETGGYTTDPTIYEIPLALRGRIECFVFHNYDRRVPNELYGYSNYNWPQP